MIYYLPVDFYVGKEYLTIQMAYIVLVFSSNIFMAGSIL